MQVSNLLSTYSACVLVGGTLPSNPVHLVSGVGFIVSMETQAATMSRLEKQSTVLITKMDSRVSNCNSWRNYSQRMWIVSSIDWMTRTRIFTLSLQTWAWWRVRFRGLGQCWKLLCFLEYSTRGAWRQKVLKTELRDELLHELTVSMNVPSDPQLHPLFLEVLKIMEVQLLQVQVLGEMDLLLEV